MDPKPFGNHLYSRTVCYLASSKIWPYNLNYHYHYIFAKKVSDISLSIGDNEADIATREAIKDVPIRPDNMRQSFKSKVFSNWKHEW